MEDNNSLQPDACLPGRQDPVWDLGANERRQDDGRVADLGEAPTFALGLAKKLFHAAVGPSLESYLEIESLVQPRLHMTADNAEGVAEFKEKRKAKFIGR